MLSVFGFLLNQNAFLLSVGLDEDYKTDREEAVSDSTQSEEEDDRVFVENTKPSETPYIVNTVEELGQVCKLFITACLSF